MPAFPFSLEKLAIIGGGKMGEAILAGLVSPSQGSACIAPESCIVVNPGYERRHALEEAYGVSCVETSAQLPACTVFILAVKPQIMPQVLEELAQHLWLPGTLCISIAAGIQTSAIEAALPKGVSVVRAMPNLPLTVGHGAVGICPGRLAAPNSAAFVSSLFEGFGYCALVEETAMDAVTALSGSGPAYVAALIEAMAQAGVELGLSENVAEKLAVATVEGTGVLLMQTGQSAKDLRKAVCSPQGTTIAALEAMEDQGFSSSIRAGVHAAAIRSKELSQ